MKNALFLVLLVTPVSALEPDHKETARLSISRYSIDHKAEAEGLRGELERTKTYHEQQLKEEKCKKCTAFLTAFASFLTAAGSFIYSVKRCA